MAVIMMGFVSKWWQVPLYSESQLYHNGSRASKNTVLLHKCVLTSREDTDNLKLNVYEHDDKYGRFSVHFYWHPQCKSSWCSELLGVISWGKNSR